MDKFLERVSKGWFLIAFLVSMVLWYADTNNKMQVVLAKQEEQQTQIDKIIDVLESTNQLKIDVAVIKNDVATIKAEIRK